MERQVNIENYNRFWIQLVSNSMWSLNRIKQFYIGTIVPNVLSLVTNQMLFVENISMVKVYWVPAPLDPLFSVEKKPNRRKEQHGEIVLSA